MGVPSSDGGGLWAFWESLIVYYCTDKFAGFPGVNASTIERMENTMLKKADVVFATAQPLAESKRRINPEVYFSPHGVDFEHFAKALDKDVNIPEEILDIIVELVRKTREEPWKKELDQGASVRAGLSLFEKAQNYALLMGHPEVQLDDLKEIAASSLVTRLKISPESKFYDDPFELVDELLQTT